MSQKGFAFNYYFSFLKLMTRELFIDLKVRLKVYFYYLAINISIRKLFCYNSIFNFNLLCNELINDLIYNLINNLINHLIFKLN